jgi:DNA topoisomerase I
MKLVLVESPTKARKLTTYLGSDYVVRASVGHIRDLPKSKMGVDIAHGFVPEYLIPRDKSKVVKELKAFAAKAEQIILATDPDREGEAIGWHLQQVLGGDDARFVRATFHEITKSAILDAIAHPAMLNMDLVNAQQARRILDRLVGYSVSPVLWKKIRYGLSAGRVQSVALRLIVEREREIEQFKPEEYWEVDVLFDTHTLTAAGEEQKTALSKKIDSYFQENKIEDIPTGMFIARVVEVDQKEYNPKAATDIQPVKAVLETARYSVDTIEKKERRRVSLPPFTTSTLQQQSATRFGYTSKSTMRLAQQMYEEGLITYHRTDSVNLSTQALDMARSYISQQVGSSYLPPTPRYFSTKTKNAQEAHEAIRPTDVQISADDVRARLGDQHAKLYDLIWRRFMASQMEAAVYDQTTVMVRGEVTEANSTIQVCRLKAAGSTLKFDGWMRFFPNQGDVLLPDLQTQQALQYQDSNAAQKFTQPPPRYNDASLIKTLEKEGIGRPSTYASIISVIEDRGYVERREKKFFPTAVGMAVNDFLVKHFDKIVDYKFTANMEDDLDAISRGEKSWQDIIGIFYAPLEKQVASVVETAERAPVPVQKTGIACPKCGETEHGEIVIREGKFGKFKSCSRFPECDFTDRIVNKVEGLICPLCQKGDVVIKPTRYGKDFYSCSRYPECDWASWIKPQPGATLTAEEWTKMKAERDARRAAREEKFGKKKTAPTAKKVPPKTKKRAPKAASKKTKSPKKS